MNKKFSTLVAGVLLATSIGTVNAAPSYAKYATASTTYATAIKAGTYYQLMTGTAGEVVAMVPATNGTYKLQTVTATGTVDARYTLWTIDVQGNATDGYRYAFVNLGTRSVLAVNPATALKAINASASATTVGGDVALWKWQDAYNPVAGFASGNEKELTSVFGAKNDSIVTWVKGTNEVYALKYALNNPVNASSAQIKVVPVDPEAIVLGVDDLNSMLWANTEKGKLKLTFDKDVEGGNPAAVNLFTKQEYKAVAPVGFPANYGYIDPTNKGWKVGLVATSATGNDLDITSYSRAFIDYVDKSQTEALLKSVKKALGTGIDYTDNQLAYEQAIAVLNEFHLYNNSTAQVTTRAQLLEELNAFQSALIANFDVNDAVYKALKKAYYEFICNTIDIYGGWGVVANITSASSQTIAHMAISRNIANPWAAETALATLITNAETATTSSKATLDANTFPADWMTKATTTGWVSLQANDATAADEKTYLKVGTEFLTSDAGNKHLKMVTAKFVDNMPTASIANPTRQDLNGRYNFQFTWYPSQDSIVIRTAGFAKKPDNVEKWEDMTPYTNPKDLGLWKASAAADETGARGTLVPISASKDPFEQNLIKIAVLADNHREVTVGSSEYKAGATPISTINTKITINGSSKYVRTTLPSGVYFFNLASNVKKVQNGKYLVASFCGSNLEYTAEEQAQLYGQAQDFGHMPRTQWVVEQNPGLAGEQTVNIYNREFPAQNVKNVQLYKGADASQIFAQYGIFTGVVGTDTLAWVKADVKKPVAGVLTNKYLGYNVVEQDELSRKSFIMDYFNGIQIGHYVNVNKTAADTTVYVDLKGEKVTLELVPVQDKDQKFGYEGTAAPQLYNRAYAIRVYDSSKLVNDNKFIVEDPDNEASYAISPVEVENAAQFYLKENNQLISEEGDTTCYYALVGGNTNAYNRVGVRDASQRFSIETACSEERVATFALKESDTPLYRRLGVSNPEDGLKDMDVNKYAKIFRVNSTAKEYLYEDAHSIYSQGKGINFLGVEGKGDDKLSALYVDTAYVRNNTKMPQYMFAVDVTEVPAGMLCPDNPEHNTDEYIANHGDCGHKVPSQGYKIGRYLVNAQDSVQLAANGKDYIWNEKYTRLSFVWAKHIGDTLIVMRHGKDMNLASLAVATDSIFLGDNKHNMSTWTLDADPSKNTKGDSINAAHEYGIKNAVFALRLVDDKPACDFLIESVGDKPIPTDGKGGWIKIQNGVPVIAKAANYNEAILDTEIFNIEPTEEVATDAKTPELSTVSVIAGTGKIVITGAAGKTVAISNILGQTIANTVLSSDNATIAAPAGVVVVAVEGEAAVKAIVK